ncbi:unnamed protein product [Pieris brassicae]|uniref:tRNA pseudouridine(55) synthase n=1 Tax=Pieris brassicae TaxID=7116 RepID=A0A9P0TQB3_PIEBR|nr:unnamed protein product [Pieris brassicae]
MNNIEVFKFCKNLGCCDLCCIRYIGYKKYSVYENSKAFVEQYQDVAKDNILHNKDSIVTSETIIAQNNETITETTNVCVTNHNLDLEESEKQENSTINVVDKKVENEEEKSETPPSKKRRLDVCVSCLGVLQEEFWSDTLKDIKDMILKKGYECKTYTCGLSAPISTILREKIITLKIVEAFPEYDPTIYTQLKDAWKMSFRPKVADFIDKSFDLDSPLLIMVHLDYPDDLQELEVLKKVDPGLFENRNKYKRRFPTEFTRQSVEQALEDAKLSKLMSSGAQLTVRGHAQCVSVVGAHAPVYLGGRYIKLSRNLPQTPWILKNVRVLPNSVEEIIFEPLAKLLNLSDSDVETRLKFISAGREDVDVRCLGDGRPFAIEISDPVRQLTSEELNGACAEVSKSGDVIVKILTYLSKDDLIQLKRGEETKCKTYEALCIKLTHSKFDDNTTESVKVTQEDIDYINKYRNTDTDDPVRVQITQKTPIRVLHRRPLLTRKREILDLQARIVPDQPQLFLLSIRTSAGTYVKEYVHGELARTHPSLSYALNADIDLLALDVTRVHLEWPPK